MGQSVKFIVRLGMAGYHCLKRIAKARNVDETQAILDALTVLSALTNAQKVHGLEIILRKPGDPTREYRYNLVHPTEMRLIAHTRPFAANIIDLMRSRPQKRPGA